MAISYVDTAWNTNGTLVSGSTVYKDLVVANCQPGDLLVAFAVAENNNTGTRTIATAAGSTGAWTLALPAITVLGDVNMVGGYALVTGAGSVTVRATLTSRQSGDFLGVGVYRIPAAEVGATYGWGPTFANDSDGLVSATLAAASVVLYGAGDWLALSPGSTLTPSGATVRRSYSDNTHYAALIGDWSAQSAGTRNYGPSGLSGRDYSGAVFRMDAPTGSIPKGSFAGAYRFGPAAAGGVSARKGSFAAAYAFGPAVASGASAHAGGFTGGYGVGRARADGSAQPQAGFAAGYAFGPAQGGGEAPSGGTFAGGWTYGPARFAGGGHVDGGFAGAYGFGPAGFGGTSPSGGGFAAAHVWGPADAAGAAGASGGFAAAYARGPALAGGAADYAGGFAATYAWGPARFGGTPDEFCWPSMLLIPLGDGTSLVGADAGSTLVPESTSWTLVEDGCRP